MSNFLIKNKEAQETSNLAYTSLNFADIEKRSLALADLIERRGDELIDILLEYESYEVAVDEISRTLDLLKHIHENEQYFKLRIGPITSFLPRNQPLYALSCFVIIPSFMASEVWFRIPHTMKHFFDDVLKILKLDDSFPNIHISRKERLEFLKERSALLRDPESGETKPVTDAVIFTGTLRNANQLRLVFDKKTLFISNGAGHNPIVISRDGDLQEAVKAVIKLQFYNQGQDCAAPNSILVHKGISDEFMKYLRDEIKATKVGDFRDKTSRIGPISEPRDLTRVQEFLIENIKWIDPSTPGIISTRDSTVAPTIIYKPLAYGGNYEEMFAPIIFVQEYESDEELKHYFEDTRYSPNAMYVTLYGTSTYVESLIGKTVNNRLLHDDSTFIRNTHLHAKGVERGTKQYGGYGHGASSLSIHGRIIPMPTLPQRDIYEQLAKPLLQQNDMSTHNSSRFTQVVYKNVSKLLQVKTIEPKVVTESALSLGDIYLDTQQLQKVASRFVRVGRNDVYTLLQEPNTSYLAGMELQDIHLIQDLQSLLSTKRSLTLDEFESKLYAIPKQQNASAEKNKDAQKNFFQNIYQLLFARNDGPRLAEFLWSVEENAVNDLLAVVNIHSQK